MHIVFTRKMLMRTWLLTWNPKRWDWKEINNDLSSLFGKKICDFARQASRQKILQRFTV